ncbi:hypothetical protein [Leptolyngbya sp. FACHB-711]|uniref:hypothetical protein n=1 Tax=unclassified Leptolyngbya TaxID=2650499 RepID=UPI001686115C|nr:hypothetical protein [Leptolyngbya sp. FACHB-711]MBD1852562.1 hypothetical protein [Cyanobacteria bacterium FACHB-502]MBD2024597.1 hypothetical protein [Leptolyngbya sp. FACHB-711]
MANEIIESIRTPTDIVIFKETEPNDSLGQANSLGNLLNFRSTIEGNVRIITTPFSSTQPSTIIRDPIDVFSFSVDRPSKLDVSLRTAKAEDVAMRLIRDLNGDGTVGLNELLSSSFQPGADEIKFDRLDSGTYFLEVNKREGFSSVDYSLIPRAGQVVAANLTIGIDRLIPLTSKSNVTVKADINGQQQVTSPSFSPAPGQNINLSASVDPGQRELSVTLRAFKPGAKVAQIPLDLDARAGKTALEFTYDTLTRQVKPKDGNGFFGSEDQIIRQTVRGDGEGTISGIRVSYDTVKQADPNPGLIPVERLPRVPIVRGSSKADPMRGGSQSGILLALGGDDRANGGDGDDIIDGGTGKDTLIGDTGDDILIGGNQNDRIFGNAGDDILEGGRGADQLTGSAGADTFVLARGKGTDIVTDFQNGQDFIGLVGLSFADLKFVQQGSSTIVQAGKEQLAQLSGVRATQLDPTDFRSITTLAVSGAIIPVLA